MSERAREEKKKKQCFQEREQFVNGRVRERESTISAHGDVQAMVPRDGTGLSLKKMSKKRAGVHKRERERERKRLIDAI